MIYLDYHSTTPCDPRVVETMLPYFTSSFGNPAAIHSIGEDAKKALENARRKVANIIGASEENIIFTHGATESNNIVLRSIPKGSSIITTNSEHSSVRDTLNDMFMTGHININYLKIDKDGNISLDELEYLLCSQPIYMVSIIAANNEIGTIHDIKKIGELCKKHSALFHTDATQAVGKIPININELNIDALSFSAHKIYGPKGIGALYVKDIGDFKCLITGGRQERLTSGTVNMPAVIGFARACELMIEETNEAQRIERLRDRLFGLLSKSGSVSLNGTMNNRLYNNLNITIEDVPAEALVMGMDDVCISTGAACLSRNPKPSHVVIALGLEHPDWAVRISLGRWTTEEDINYAADKINSIIKSIRSNNV